MQLTDKIKISYPFHCDFNELLKYEIWVLDQTSIVHAILSTQINWEKMGTVFVPCSTITCRDWPFSTTTKKPTRYVISGRIQNAQADGTAWHTCMPIWAHKIWAFLPE